MRSFVSLTSSLASFLVAVSTLVLGFGPRAAGADDPAGGGGEAPPVRIHAVVDLEPPEGAANADASGAVFLRQRGERKALHVFVRGLEPAATYEVVAVKGDASESLGSLTTRSATVTPRCYSVRLAAPVLPEPPPAEEEPPVANEPPAGDPGAGDGADNGARAPRHGGRGGRGDDHGEGDGRPGDGDGEPRPASGGGLFLLSREGDALRYFIHLRGVEGPVTAVHLVIGDGEPIALDAEDLRGRVDVTAEQLAALASGAGRVDIVTGAEPAAVVLTGGLESCISQEARDAIGRRRAGTGALRLDTRRGDTIPFCESSLADLVGVRFDVRAADGAVVLSGTVDSVTGAPAPGGGDPAGGGGDPAGGVPVGAAPPAGGEDDDDGFFGISELHDARLVRGDVNDDGAVDLSDAVALLSHLFQGAGAPYCPDAADTDDDGALALTDAVYLLGNLFRGQGPIPAPSGRAGFDPTPDTLFCAAVEE